ncbi:MAG: hypothetical protein Q4D19_04585 [Lautropia sp.]|nr:hypothetical protein [Lautropia sp.]
MKKMKHRARPHVLTPSLLALAVLAACGQGGEGPGTAPTQGARTDTPPVAEAPAATVDTLAPADSAQTKAPGDIGTSDISAELMMELLLHGTTGNGWRDEFFAHPAWPWRGPGPHGSVNTEALGRLPNLYGGQQLQPETTRNQYTFQMSTWYGRDTQPPAFRFRSVDTRFQLTPGFNALFNPEPLGKQLLHSGSRTPDSPLVTLGNAITTHIHTDAYRPEATPGEQHQLTSAQPWSIRAGERVPLHRPLHTWRDANGNFVELMVLSGASKNQLRLCLNQHLPGIKRLSCNLWEVGTDSPYGYALKPLGIYVADDRSTVPGENGHLFWQSSGSHPRHGTPPLGSRGIRADLLATALLQTVQPTSATGMDYLGWAAEPWESSDVRGKPHSNREPSIQGWSSAALPGTNGKHPSYHSLNSFQDPTETGQPLAVFPEIWGGLELSALHGRGYGGMGYEPPDGSPSMDWIHANHLLSAGRYPTHGSPLLTLGTSASANFKTATAQGNQGGSTRIELSTRNTRTLTYGSVVPRFQVLQRWESAAGDQFMELMVLDSYRNDQFRLCFNLHLPVARRLFCSIWQVPANWKLDEPLVFNGIYVADDRSVAGESGHRYWMTPPERSGAVKQLKQRALKARLKALQLKQEGH